MRRFMLLICLSLCLLVSTALVAAQDAAPEATPESTTDAPVEALTTSEIFAQLPHTRLEDGGFVIGDPDAPITIIEFADYACPHCQDYRPVIEQVITDYIATGQAKFELRIFPTAGGQLTYFVGQFVECAEHQRPGAFWASYDLLYDYATSRRYDQNVGRLLASELDINYAKLLVCAQNAQQVLTDITFGENHGVTGTPAVMVRYGNGDAQFITYNDVTYNGGGVAYNIIAQVIEQANNSPMPTEEPTEGVIIRRVSESANG